MQQEQARSLQPAAMTTHHAAVGIGPKSATLSHHSTTYITPLTLVQSHLGHQDQAIRLSISLSHQPVGVAVGNHKSYNADHNPPLIYKFFYFTACPHHLFFEDLV
jgi:hypothetical protein